MEAGRQGEDNSEVFHRRGAEDAETKRMERGRVADQRWPPDIRRRDAIGAPTKTAAGNLV